MLHAKHPLTSFVTGLVQGLFRAGHLFLIALGLVALTQVIPVPHGKQHAIDAMGGTMGRTTAGSDPAMFMANNAPANPAAQWFAAVQAGIAQLADTLGRGAVAVALPQPAIAAMTATPPVRETSPATTRLTSYLAARYRVSDQVVEGLVITAQETGKELNVDPLLIISVMAVESSFNPLSESKFGAQGLMQVIPKYHMDKIADDAGELALFHPETNIRVGTLVLREYIRRYGSVEAALQNYAGAPNDPETGYARKVLGTRDRLAQTMRG